jgi:hypothetical protein
MGNTRFNINRIFLAENFMLKPTVILRDNLSHFLMEQDPAFVVEQVKKVFGE